MNAYTSQDELALLPANRMSYTAQYASPVQASQGLYERVLSFFHRQAAIREMSNLTDRELRDIGLSRGELSHVFDHGFVARRSC